MRHEFVKVTECIVVKGDLDNIQVADDVDLLKEDAKAVVVAGGSKNVVVIADVHLVTEDVKVVVPVSTNFVEEASMVRAMVTAIS
jgi:hypothetical protein